VGNARLAAAADVRKNARLPNRLFCSLMIDSL
jgi:hypothetical protein